MYDVVAATTLFFVIKVVQDKLKRYLYHLEPPMLQSIGEIACKMSLSSRIALALTV
jgi:hypothetical protein